MARTFSLVAFPISGASFKARLTVGTAKPLSLAMVFSVGFSGRPCGFRSSTIVLL